MTTSTDTLDGLFAGLRVDQFSGRFDHEAAYEVLLRLLDHARLVGDRTTPAELWTVLQSIPGSEPFGSRARLHQLLHTAERDGQIRRTATGHILLRLDAPFTGGPMHVWVRLEGRGGSEAEVEITGADPWPENQLHAPGPAWWCCTGCRDHSGSLAQDFLLIRDAATDHARTCRALPAPPAVA
ncbi:hypothetical protein [Streptomyces sp. RKAG293]|uniref:hypothetical protein n=1 Tax=Streptomyces sp. RKAG293 TaxID=2893403 RepID=UPI002033C4FC|nr:hypothetical protein [Streptomyces sp. RKAG293]MCM2424191.1 hypothetical protein [Streptomyces sp. RKAG293]